MDATPLRLQPARPWRDLSIMALLLGATAWLSLSLARVPDGVAAVWITNGIWAGWLLSRRTASWPGYLAAGYLSQLAVHFQVGDDWIPGAALSAFNLLEVLIIAGAIRCVIPDVSNPRSWLGLGSVATASTLVACASPA